MSPRTLEHYVGGAFVKALSDKTQSVRNPATGEILAEVPLGAAADVDRAVRAAASAFEPWRRTPVLDRIQPLFRLKMLLDKHQEEISRTVSRENGKLLDEARGSVRRGIQCVEVATGAPSLLLGQVLEDVGAGIDCASIRQPLGVFTCITPFNFPAMVPLWFFPIAVAAGNTFVCKPSEQVPLSQDLIFHLIHEAGFPPGVLNLIHGGAASAEALMAHPDIQGVSFVGSSTTAKHVYATAAKAGKRVQALGGAKNFIVVMPDAAFENSIAACSASAFGCAGERCLAGSIILTVGDIHDRVRARLSEIVRGLRLGSFEDPKADMGPVISEVHRERVLRYIENGVHEGAELVVDGRKAPAPKQGYFLGASLFDRVTPEMTIAREEIFGPVLCLMNAATLEAALSIIKRHPLANAASIFTTSGKAARTFQYEVPASMTGVNIGVAAPMSIFGFGGARGSFFGDLKAHGREAFDFYTDRKVVISRWE